MKTPESIAEAARMLGLPTEELAQIAQRLANGSSTKSDRETIRKLTPLQTRPCGDCDLCCSAPAIEENVIDGEEDGNFAPKPACQKCQFANGKGCGIYEDRPSVCKDYYCLWSLGLIPAKHYPLHKGVCWTVQPIEGDPEGSIIMGHALDVKKTLQDPSSVQLIADYIAQGKEDGTVRGVAIRDDKEAVMFGTDGSGRMASVNQSDPMRMEIVESSESSFDFRFERGSQ
jgi:hypothetical protein